MYDNNRFTTTSHGIALSDQLLHTEMVLDLCGSMASKGCIAQKLKLYYSYQAECGMDQGPFFIPKLLM